MKSSSAAAPSWHWPCPASRSRPRLKQHRVTRPSPSPRPRCCRRRAASTTPTPTPSSSPGHHELVHRHRARRPRRDQCAPRVLRHLQQRPVLRVRRPAALLGLRAVRHLQRGHDDGLQGRHQRHGVRRPAGRGHHRGPRAGDVEGRAEGEAQGRDSQGLREVLGASTIVQMLLVVDHRAGGPQRLTPASGCAPSAAGVFRRLKDVSQLLLMPAEQICVHQRRSRTSAASRTGSKQRNETRPTLDPGGGDQGTPGQGGATCWGRPYLPIIVGRERAHAGCHS